MTPSDLLERAKTLIAPQLLVDNDTLLQSLLYKALGEYQSRVGSTQSVQVSALEAAEGFPVAFTHNDFIVATDREGEPYAAYVDGTGRIHVETDDYCQWPITASYLVDLRQLDFDTGVMPKDVFQVTLDYLKVLIDRENLPRVRAAYESSQLSTDFLPTYDDIRAELERIETRMSEMTMLLPAVMVVS